MNQHLHSIFDIIEQQSHLSADQKADIINLLKKADRELEISNFKLDRTEKVKRTTAILLEETITELEQKRKLVEESNKALEKSLEDLKAAQAQLIQSEKMASLGELTAGIAHEIQNPLNFVNNFSEVSAEMIDDLFEEIANKDFEEMEAISSDIKQNLNKIHHHGKRAESIVRGMLLHSRSSKGEKIPTDINALCDEFLRLSYHGLRAKDRNFNAEFEVNFDKSIPKIEVVPQDIGRVLLNLINNAFQAAHERSTLEGLQTQSSENYKPHVVVTTVNNPDNVEFSVKDNGLGIPEEIIDKIFQPFFTTKSTGQGTGLGLSLAYDIVTAHGGELKVSSSKSKGTCFTVILPKVSS